MPENILPPFVRLKNMFKESFAAAGEKLPDRSAHRMAQGFMLSHAAEAYQWKHSDDTGEEAVKRALTSYIEKFGSLRGPVTA